MQKAIFTLLIILVIEFLDELVFGIREAAWPFVRDDVGISYLQIGLLLSIPAFVSNFIEPFFALAADVWDRKRMILIGGVLMGLAVGLVAVADGFWLLLLAFLIMYPASGLFVSTTQASLMDREPAKREKNMARWTLAGSVGNVVGPLLLTLVVAVNLSWRPLFAAMAVLIILFTFLSPKISHKTRKKSDSYSQVFKGMFRSFKNKGALRWLVLLQFSDLMLDVLFGFVALYFVDVAGTTPGVAALAVSLWTGVGLLGDLLLVLLLERFNGRRYLKFSAWMVLLIFPLFLLVQNIVLKMVLLAFLGLFNAGWYSILTAGLYDSLPEKSGTALAMSNIMNLLGALMVMGLGFSADRLGLGNTMWFLLAGPVALIIGLSTAGSVKPRASELDPESRH